MTLIISRPASLDFGTDFCTTTTLNGVLRLYVGRLFVGARR
ncbi:MAG: hypothetical protein R3E39_14990 [Anaerolineae bacterium]